MIVETPGRIVRHRRPTLSFVRPTDVEPDTRVSLYWNGSRAKNGDGLPGGDDPVDYGQPVGGPLAIWKSGHLQMFSGGWCDGGWAEGGAAVAPTMGWCSSPWVVGPWGIGGGFWMWACPFFLRDGIYRFALRLLDLLGNERQQPEATVTPAVEAPPRPATRARLADYDDQARTLTIDWGHSPDLLTT